MAWRCTPAAGQVHCTKAWPPGTVPAANVNLNADRHILAAAPLQSHACADRRGCCAVERARAGIGGLRSRLFPRGGKLDDATVVAAMLTTTPLQP